MKKSIIVLVSAVVAALLLCGPMVSIYAGSGDQDGGLVDGKHLPWMRRLMRDLTSDQRREICQLIQDMRGAGSSPQEIKEAVDAKLAEWGIEASESPSPPPASWMEHLTEEQRRDIRQLIEEMRRNGASRGEIVEAVLQRLEEYGVDTTHIRVGGADDGFMRRHRGPHLEYLTEEQRNELLQKIQELRESGASQRQIRDMIHAQLEEWGIKIPECGEP
ncbi:MAG: hypothetical protein QW638_08420 [Candidatus Bathyarchaeia archaeon]